VPHWKQVIFRFSTAGFSGAARALRLAGAAGSPSRKCARHELWTEIRREAQRRDVERLAERDGD